MPDFFSPNELADYLCVPVSTVSPNRKGGDMEILGAVKAPDTTDVRVTRPTDNRVAVTFDFTSLMMTNATYTAMVAAIAADQRAVIEEEPPVEVDAFINLRKRPARAIARGDWIDVGDHDFRQVMAKTHGNPVTYFILDGCDQPYAWANDALRTVADRVTDCEGSTMPERTDSWDVV